MVQESLDRVDLVVVRRPVQRGMILRVKWLRNGVGVRVVAEAGDEQTAACVAHAVRRRRRRGVERRCGRRNV